MRIVNQKNNTDFLRKEHKITPKRLFKIRNKKRKEKIMDHLFKVFTEHKMRYGMMATKNPKSNQYEYYNYRSYSHIKSMKTLPKDMRTLIIYKEKHINQKDYRMFKVHKIKLQDKRLERLRKSREKEKERYLTR